MTNNYGFCLDALGPVTENAWIDGCGCGIGVYVNCGHTALVDIDDTACGDGKSFFIPAEYVQSLFEPPWTVSMIFEVDCLQRASNFLSQG